MVSGDIKMSQMDKGSVTTWQQRFTEDLPDYDEVLKQLLISVVLCGENAQLSDFTVF